MLSVCFDNDNNLTVFNLFSSSSPLPSPLSPLLSLLLLSSLLSPSPLLSLLLLLSLSPSPSSPLPTVVNVYSVNFLHNVSGAPLAILSLGPEGVVLFPLTLEDPLSAQFS